MAESRSTHNGHTSPEVKQVTSVAATQPAAIAMPPTRGVGITWTFRNPPHVSSNALPFRCEPLTSARAASHAENAAKTTTATTAPVKTASPYKRLLFLADLLVRRTCVDKQASRTCKS